MVALFVEGRSDAAVIGNILIGKLGIDSSDIMYLLPEYDFDNTDLSVMGENQFSNWTLVKKACIERHKLANYFDIFDDERIAIIQIDSAERNLEGYDVPNPQKTNENPTEYCIAVRENVLNKIKEWLGGEYEERCFFAIAIEEIEAWVLTLFIEENSKTDTSKYHNPKKELLNRINLQLSKNQKSVFFSKGIFEQYLSLSKPFKKRKQLKKAAEKNHSLKLFLDSLNQHKN